QTPPHDHFQLRTDLIFRLRELRRLFLQDRVHHLDGRIAVKGALPGEHFVKDHAEREDVRAMIRLLSSHLLWRHVTDRTHNHARIGDPFLCRRVLVYAELLRAEFSQTEIEDLHPPVVHDEQVLRLQVTMDDAFGMRGGQSLGDLPRVIDSLSRSDCALFYQFAQLLAFEQFGDDIGRAFMRADVVNREDVRVVERRGGAGFLLEAAQAIRIPGELGGQQLDGDLATESRVFGQIDLAHPACAELRYNLIVVEAWAWGNDHIASLTAIKRRSLDKSAPEPPSRIPTRCAAKSGS